MTRYESKWRNRYKAKPIEHTRKRFLRFVQIGAADECWPWLGTTVAAAWDPAIKYGRFWFNYRMTRAPRVAYLLFVGSIPDGQLIRHRCDNPICVNPAHLEPGTHQDNNDDCVSRGRARRRRGADSPCAKLTEAQAEEAVAALNSGESGVTIAARYGVTSTTIYRVRDRAANPRERRT